METRKRGWESRVSLGFALGALFALSGCLGKVDGAQDAIVRNWANSLEHMSNFTRSSGRATGVRLKAIFPDLKIEAEIEGGDGSTAADRSFAKALVAGDRPVTVLSFAALTRITENRCAAKTGNRVELFAETGANGSVWMTGETPPADADARLVTVAARRAWLYPFTDLDPEVQELLNLYLTVKTSTGSDPVAKQAVCQAVITAPYFWIGVPRENSGVTRLATELAGRLPTFDEMGDIKNGRLTISEYVRNLQSEQGYLSTVHEWHRNWLDFQEYPHGAGADGLPPVMPSSDTFQASMLPQQAFVLTKRMLTGPSGQFEAVIALPFNQIVSERDALSEQCLPVVQDFDPITTKLVFEFWDRTAKTYKTMSTSTKTAGVWDVVPGNIPNPAGGFISVQDVDSIGRVSNETFNASEYPPEAFAYYKWRGGAGIGATATMTSNITMQVLQFTSPTAAPTALHGTRFREGEFRIRRYGSNGQEQNGFSRAKLWWSREDVYVCNQLARMAATCAYRPTATDPPPTTTMPQGEAWSNRTRNGKVVGARVMHGIQYNANGRTLDAHRCGIPNQAEILKANTTGYNEDIAFPRTPPYNDLAHSMYIDKGVTYDGTITEYKVKQQIVEDLAAEPYRLLDHILTGRRDYRELLTADYTFGHKPLQYYFLTQAWPMVVVPEGAPASPDDSDFVDGGVNQFSTADFPVVPRELLRSSRNTYGRGQYATLLSNTGSKGVKLTGLTPRPQSGILTQYAFTMPMSPKLRSLVARLFVRVMCTLPSGVPLSESKKKWQSQYMYHPPEGKSSHLPDPDDKDANMKKPCYSCHVQMDPAGKALAKWFLWDSDVENPSTYAYTSGPEMIPHESETSFWGIRGSSDPQVMGEGAFKGKVVRGVKELGAAIANSPEFHRCAATKAFEALYGRAPSFLDIKIFDAAMKSFQDSGYDYNEMVYTLATQKEFLDAK